MKSLILFFITAIILAGCREVDFCDSCSAGDLHFPDLASSWDEGIPLGNGMLGALVWKKEGKLRFSLDRADLWDLRPMENLDREEWKYKWVHEQWKNGTYKAVQDAFDKPYDVLPAPSKIPAGAMEFDIESLGVAESVSLDIRNATCSVKWKNGATLLVFVHADEQAGWFRFKGLSDSLAPEIVPPAYSSSGDGKALEMSFFDLERLGYRQGVVKRTKNTFSYEQEGWGGFSYSIRSEWKTGKDFLEGCWSISSQYPGREEVKSAAECVADAFNNGFERSLRSHARWWTQFWNASSLTVPDSVLQRQWCLDIYKFGSAARADAPPVSLQAVWTADNGKLPPWKGDYHNDLNTQLSYWPAYSSNHLDLEEGFINWLLDNREAFRRYTRSYFETGGLNVPGVATLEGEPMGGWIQYSFGPTVSAWLSHHFYLHWRYSMDRDFLESKAYPWIKEVAQFISELSVKGSDGKRKLPISSSPEIFNNSAEAWFGEISNFDLSLIRWTYEKAAELAEELSLKDEAASWKTMLSEWPWFASDPVSGLKFTAAIPYEESHRHFSHLMAFHPLGIIDYSQGDSSRKIIDNTLNQLEITGPDWWCGYSYSWLGNLYARAFNGTKAAEALKIFSECFCLPNSFHVNGDQTRSGKSKFTYRPFTLEGNFAFAAGLQEMLIQSHTGIVRIFPAIPADWKDLSFNKLRTEGAFLVSASMTDGITEEVKIYSEKGGTITIESPFSGSFTATSKYRQSENLVEFTIPQGKTVKMTRTKKT